MKSKKRQRAAEQVEEIREWAGPRVEAAKEWAAPRVEATKEWAAPRMEAAKDWAAPRLEAMGPKASAAAERVGPAMDTARDKIVDDLLPRIKEAMDAAVAAGLAHGREAGLAETPTTEEEAMGKERKGKKGKIMMFGALAAAGAAAMAAWKRKTQPDPWTTDMMTDDSTARTTGSSTSTPMSTGSSTTRPMTDITTPNRDSATQDART